MPFSGSQTTALQPYGAPGRTRIFLAKTATTPPVTPDERKISVEAENRTATIAAESRTVQVKTETRTVTITAQQWQEAA